MQYDMKLLERENAALVQDRKVAIMKEARDKKDQKEKESTT